MVVSLSLSSMGMLKYHVHSYRVSPVTCYNYLFHDSVSDADNIARVVPLEREEFDVLFHNKLRLR